MYLREWAARREGDIGIQPIRRAVGTHTFINLVHSLLCAWTVAPQNNTVVTLNITDKIITDIIIRMKKFDRIRDLPKYDTK